LDDQVVLTALLTHVRLLAGIFVGTGISEPEKLPKYATRRSQPDVDRKRQLKMREILRNKFFETAKDAEQFSKRRPSLPDACDLASNYRTLQSLNRMYPTIQSGDRTGQRKPVEIVQ